MKSAALLLLLCALLLPGLALGESLTPEEMALAPQAAPVEASPAPASDAAPASEASALPSAREEMIDGILSLAKTLYEQAGGRPQRAHYAGDIYVCKNFTVHLFTETAGAYRMAQYPDTPLVIPDNLPRAECEPYAYGVVWKDVPAEQGNPFEVAGSFRYDSSLSAQENREAARALLMQVQRGDYFQMAADYYYGVGAHSMIFSADYDPQTDTVHWTDSNMKGEKRGGERYGYVQYDAERKIDWFVDAFCRKRYGATLYRLREDIVRAP